MTVILNWLIAFAVLLLFFAGLYLVIKLAVKSAVREVAREEVARLAQKLWDEDREDDGTDPAARA